MASPITLVEEKKTKEVDYSETIKILANRLIIVLVILFVLSAVLKKFTF